MSNSLDLVRLWEKYPEFQSALRNLNRGSGDHVKETLRLAIEFQKGSVSSDESREVRDGAGQQGCREKVLSDISAECESY